VNFTRYVSVVAITTAVSLVGTHHLAAQSLSDSAVSLTSSWSTGYMGLGGNLGKAIGDRHSARHAKTTSAARVEKRTVQRRAASRMDKAVAHRPSTESPIYLISQSLDHTGMNIGAMQVRTRGP
jgi:hypothetical protein